MNGRQLVLVRHGETQWSRTGRHTGRTDVPLTELGQRQANALGSMLRGRPFAAVLVSPLQRATETLRRASLDVARVRVLQELVEWDYGDYEGLTTEEIRRSVPDWTIWTAPVPGGESAADVGRRADLAIGRALDESGDVAIFAHGHLGIVELGKARHLVFGARVGEAHAHLPGMAKTFAFGKGCGDEPKRLFKNECSDRASRIT